MSTKSQFNKYQFNSQEWNTEIPIIGIFNESITISDTIASQYIKILNDFLFNYDSLVSQWTEIVRTDVVKINDWLSKKRSSNSLWSD